MSFHSDNTDSAIAVLADNAHGFFQLGFVSADTDNVGGIFCYCLGEGTAVKIPRDENCKFGETIRACEG